MTSKVISFPSKIRPAEPVQLDLFSVEDFFVGKYSFLDIKNCDERQLASYLDDFKFRLILDLRIFPSFDRPKFDHKEMLARFRRSGALYFPIVYFTYTNEMIKQLSAHKNSLRDKSKQGPILLIYDDKNSSDEYLFEWKKIIERKISGTAEIIPSAVSRKNKIYR